MSSSEAAACNHTLHDVETALANGAELSDESLQSLMEIAVRLYAERVERGGDVAVVKPDAINATDALITTTALLRAVNVQTFELGLWQSFMHH